MRFVRVGSLATGALPAALHGGVVGRGGLGEDDDLACQLAGTEAGVEVIGDESIGRMQQAKAEAPSLSGNRPHVVTKVYRNGEKPDEPISDWDDPDQAWGEAKRLQQPVQLGEGYYYTVYPRRNNTPSKSVVKPKPNTPDDRPGAKGGLVVVRKSVKQTKAQQQKAREGK